MKTIIFTILFTSFITCAFAQPVIQNGDGIPAPGFSAPASMSTGVTNVGSGGANQTWDFSSLTFTPVGTYNVIEPLLTPFGSSYPTANYAYELSGTYSFFNVLPAKMEVIAYSIVIPGSGNDYTPNPRTVLKFPFNFLETETDIWQKVNGSPNEVLLTYDGYGTLITPTKTYLDVVRIKEEYENGGIDYQWYILNPLMSILVYDHNEKFLFNIDAPITTGISVENPANNSISIFPNPVKDMMTIQISNVSFSNEVKICILNSLGQTIEQMTTNSEFTKINLSDLKPGLYFYQIYDAQEMIKSCKFVVER